MKENGSDVGYLPAVSVGTLVMILLMWAAMHDIARGDGPLEYGVFGVSVAGLALVHGYGMKWLEGKERKWWLRGMGLVVLVFNGAAVVALVEPKYVADRMMGVVWLSAGIPWLVVIGHQLKGAKRRTR